MSASLTLGLRTLKRIGEQIVSKEIVISVNAKVSNCPRPIPPRGEGSVQGNNSLTHEPGSQVVKPNPSEEEKPTSNNS